MDSANNDRATLYINRHFRHRRRRVSDRQLRKREKESAKGGGDGGDGGVIEIESCKCVRAVCELADDRFTSN